MPEAPDSDGLPIREHSLLQGNGGGGEKAASSSSEAGWEGIGSIWGITRLAAEQERRGGLNLSWRRDKRQRLRDRDSNSPTVDGRRREHQSSWAQHLTQWAPGNPTDLAGRQAPGPQESRSMHATRAIPQGTGKAWLSQRARLYRTAGQKEAGGQWQERIQERQGLEPMKELRNRGKWEGIGIKGGV